MPPMNPDVPAVITPRRAWAALILLAQLAVTAWLGWLATGLELDNRIERFAVHKTPGEQAYRTFTDAFEDTEAALVTLLFREAPDHGLSAAIFAELADVSAVEAVLSRARFVNDDGSLPPLPFPFIDGRHETALLVIRDSTDRGTRLTRLLAEAERLEQKHADVLEAINVAGEPIVNHYLNQGAAEVKTRFFPLLIVSSLVLLGLLFRGVGPLAVTALTIAGSLASTLGIMRLAGETLNLITTLIPALIFVLATAMQVHVLLAISVHGSLRRGLREKLVPNLLIAATTSIGFASLMTSSVTPIAMMGRYMALAVWAIFVWVHLTHLGWSVLVNARFTPPHLLVLRRLFDNPRYNHLIRFRRFLVLPLLVIAGGVWALSVNPTESNGLAYFDADHPIRESTRWLERHVTGGSQLELLISRTEPLEEDEAAYYPGEDKVPDLETALLEIPHIRHLFSLYQLSLTAEEADGDIPEEVLDPFLSPDYYRIRLLVDAVDERDYAVMESAILAAVEEAGITEPVHVTGSLARVIEIQRYLLSSLLTSMALTVIAVIALLYLVLGRGRRLLTFFLPNLFPLGCMALAMPVLGIETTIASVMVFSIAFGIAVDDTVHLIATFRDHPAKEPVTRWHFTLTQDARAVFLTSLVLCTGFLVLLTSSFIPTRDFAILLTIGIASAYVGDVLFLPMLLMGGPKNRSARV